MTSGRDLVPIAERVFHDLLPRDADDAQPFLAPDGSRPSTVRTSDGRGRPDVETRIWRPGDVGWVADIIEMSWSRWLLVYPREWRTVGQAIPYVRLRGVHECDQPKTDEDREVESLNLEDQMETRYEELERWRRGGKLGPEPDMPPPITLGHTHAHDHGICIDPWLADHASVNATLKGVLRHELAHAIAGTFGHNENWVAMCKIIGHELCARERRLVRRMR